MHKIVTTNSWQTTMMLWPFIGIPSMCVYQHIYENLFICTSIESVSRRKRREWRKAEEFPQEVYDVVLNLRNVINGSERSADVCVSFWDVNIYGWHSVGIFIRKNKQLRDKKLKSCWILSGWQFSFLLISVEIANNFRQTHKYEIESYNVDIIKQQAKKEAS